MWVLFEICLVVCCKFKSLDQHTFELLTFILFANFVTFVYVGIWQLVFAYLCPRVVSTAADHDFGKQGCTFPFFPQSAFGFSSLALSYLVSFEVCFMSEGVL